MTKCMCDLNIFDIMSLKIISENSVVFNTWIFFTKPVDLRDLVLISPQRPYILGLFSICNLTAVKQADKQV